MIEAGSRNGSRGLQVQNILEGIVMACHACLRGFPSKQGTTHQWITNLLHSGGFAPRRIAVGPLTTLEAEDPMDAEQTRGRLMRFLNYGKELVRLA